MLNELDIKSIIEFLFGLAILAVLAYAAFALINWLMAKFPNFFPTPVRIILYCIGGLVALLFLGKLLGLAL